MNMSRISQKLTRKNLAGVFDQSLVSGSTFLTIALCAHSLPPAEQGKLGYVIALYTAALTINTSTVFQGASVRVPGKSDQAGYLSMLLLMQLTLAVVITGTIYIGLGIFGERLGWVPTFSEGVYLGGFLALQQLTDFERRTGYIFGDAMQALAVSMRTYPLRILTLAIVAPTNLETALLILCLTTVPGAFGMLFKISKCFHSTKSKIESAWAHLKFSVLLILGAPLSWLWLYIPVFALGMVRGPESVAVLISIRSLTNAANVLREQIEIQLPVRMARARAQHGNEAAEAIAGVVLKAGSILWLLGFIMVWVAGEWIVGFVFGKHYQSYSALLSILWLAYGVQFMVQTNSLKHRALHNLWVEFLSSAVAVVLAVVVAYPLVDGYGVFGAGWLIVLIAIFSGATQLAVSRFTKS